MSNIRTSSNLIALAWDDDELRIATARRKEDGYVVQHAFAVRRNLAETPLDDLGKLIAQELSQRRVARGDAVVVVGRSMVELKQMSFPPVPDDELPEMVRMLAPQHFDAVDGREPCVDFMPLSSSNGHGSAVLAAAISPDRLDEIQQVCKAAGLNLKHVVLRPCLTSILSTNASANGAASSLELVAQDLGLEIDMAVLNQGRLSFMRTTRLPPAEGCDRNNLLAMELKRTLFTAKNDLGGGTVQRVVLYGSSDNDDATQRQLCEELDCPVELHDPFATWPHELVEIPPGRERFTPLLSALAEQNADHQINFLSPRQPKTTVDHRRRYVAAATGLAALALLAIGWTYYGMKQLDNEIASKRLQLADQKKIAERSEKFLQSSDIIKEWDSRDPIWLDEVHRLADRFPDSERAKLSRMEFRGEDTGTLMILQAYVDDSKTISEIEKDLRDEHRKVYGDGGRKDTNDSQYPWRFTARMDLQLPAKDPVQDAATSNKQTKGDPSKVNASNESSAMRPKNGDVSSSANPTTKNEKTAEQP